MTLQRYHIVLLSILLVCLGGILGLRWVWVSYYPPKLSPQASLKMYSNNKAWPKEKVTITLGAYGIPEVRAENEEDLLFGLGFIHARDRLFQIDMLRHAARGTLSELFGSKGLEIDKKLRILTFQLEQQYAALTVPDQILLEAYAAGINEGASHAGKSLQHLLIRQGFSPFLPQDALAIARLQAWDLAVNVEDEIILLSMEKSLAKYPAVLKALQPTVDSGGFPIVSSSSQASPSSVTPLPYEPLTPFSKNNTFNEIASPPLRTPKKLFRVRPPSSLESNLGASNSWAVSGKHTQNGNAVLCNDPHLNHRTPSTFYLARLISPGIWVEGASAPGMPVILMGHSPHLAWGMTASFADVQDLVAVKKADLIPWPQRFAEPHAPEGFIEEMWYKSTFGPVLPPHFSKGLLEENAFAIMWGGFLPGGVSSQIVSGFWNLVQSQTLEEGRKSAQQFSIAGLNVLLAATNGEIAYQLSATLPVRNSSPLSPWKGLLPSHYLPSLTNPDSGFIITANQRVAENTHPLSASLGETANLPYRALRIKERIESLLRQGKEGVTLAHLMDIQQDILSIEARELSPIFSLYCTDNSEACRALHEFDAYYTTSSQGALIFELFFFNFVQLIQEYWLPQAAISKVQQRYFLFSAVSKALRALKDNAVSPLFLNQEGETRLPQLMKEALQKTITTLEEQIGLQSNKWTWGALHLFQPIDPFAEIPVIGKLFAVKGEPETGNGRTVRAEKGPQDTHGAALRMCVEMSSPPKAYMVLDVGNSGHLQSPHYEDQYPLWHKGESIDMATVFNENQIEGKIIITPAL